MEFANANEHRLIDIESIESDQPSSVISFKKENEYNLRYFSEKLDSYEMNINTTYLNIKHVLNQLEEEFPEIDITSKINPLNRKFCKISLIFSLSVKNIITYSKMPNIF